jgi:hypothetical protein
MYYLPLLHEHLESLVDIALPGSNESQECQLVGRVAISVVIREGTSVAVLTSQGFNCSPFNSTHNQRKNWLRGILAESAPPHYWVSRFVRDHLRGSFVVGFSGLLRAACAASFTISANAAGATAAVGSIHTVAPGLVYGGLFVSAAVVYRLE